MKYSVSRVNFGEGVDCFTVQDESGKCVHMGREEADATRIASALEFAEHREEIERVRTATDNRPMVFLGLLNERARELAPDYPFSDKSDAFDLLWAITSSLEGTNLANDDCHAEITRLRGLLDDAHGWLMRIAQHNAAAQAALAHTREDCDLNVLRAAADGEWSAALLSKLGGTAND